jgi:ketosteroid isomerase-like protein
MIFAFTLATLLASAAPDISTTNAAGTQVGQAALSERVADAREKLVAAILSNDPAARAALYREGAISMPPYQPNLFGRTQVLAYHRALQPRLKLTEYSAAPSEIFNLGDTALEIGSFTAVWMTSNGAAEERRGQYANVWSIEPDGGLKLKADVWSFSENLPDPAVFHVALPETATAQMRPGAGDQQLAQLLDRLNRENATAVRNRDLEAKLAVFTEDAVIMPFADVPKKGMGEIRPYLTQYTANGEGISFDDVRVWNIGFEDHGDYVIEYSKFHVDWRWPDNSGVTKGGGLRLWKRLADGSLKRHREIGTHDHVE